MILYLKRFLILLVILALALPLTLPFFRPGFFTTHDGEWAVIRLTAFHFALKDGQLPPRWAGNLFHTYGYPVMNFNYPLPTILGESFHLIGFNFVDSVKAVFVLSILGSGVFMFLLLFELFGTLTAIFGTILYLYYPFRLVDLFVRGSIGESLTFAILPIIFFSLIKLRKKQSQIWIIIASGAIASLVLAHNSIAFATLPLVFLFMIFNLLTAKNETFQLSLKAWHENKKTLYNYLLVIFLSLGLTCFFWLPALAEKKYIILNPEVITKPTEHFPSLQSLLIPSWGYGRSAQSDSLSFQLGPLHLLLAIIAGFFVIKRKIFIGIFFLCASLIYLLFLLQISAPLWKIIPLIAYMSYPWRLLLPLGFCLTIVACFVSEQIPHHLWRRWNESLRGKKIPRPLGWRRFIFSQSRSETKRFSAIFIIFLILYFSTRSYRKPIAYINKDDMYYITNQATTIEGDENTPIWVKQPPVQAPTEKVEGIQGQWRILQQKSNLLEIYFNIPTSQKALINTIYYPGWYVFLDGKRQPIDYQNLKGIISFTVPAGRHEAKLIFRETPLRLIADSVSIVSVIFMGIIFLAKNILKKRKILSITAIFVILTFYSLNSFLETGLFESHDGSFHLQRIYLMKQELLQGQFPVRWVGDLYARYGYPTFNFYYPGSYYLTQPFLFLGLDSVDAYKIIIFLTYFLSGFFMFLWSRNYWGELGGLVSSFLYLYAPYRFISLFVSGIFGVAISFAILPFIFWSLDRLAKETSSRNLAIVSLSTGVLILVHNVTFLIFFPLIVAYALYLVFRAKNKLFILSTFFISFTFSLTVTAFFILPMVSELKFVKLKDSTVAASYQEHFPQINQLLYSKWGYGYSVVGSGDGMSFQLGLTKWVILIILIGFLFFKKKREIRHRYLIYIFLLFFLLTLFLMLQESNFIWKIIPVLQRVQFPWKLLAVEIFILSFLGGSIISLVKSKHIAWGAALFIIFLVLYTSRNHLRPATPDRFDESHFVKNAFTADTSAELLPVWSKQIPDKLSGRKLKIISGEGTLREINTTSIEYNYEVNIKDSAKIVAGSLYFPGWNVYIDGQKTSTSIEDESGIFSFFIESGWHKINVRFEDTIIRVLGNYLSLVSIFILLSLFLINEKIKH